MKTTVHVAGLREIEAALGNIAKTATRKAVGRRALTKAAKPIDDSWRSRVRVKWGDLKRSGGVSTKLSRRQKALATKMSPVEVYVGPGALAQAVTEEFGTSDQAPHPTLRPAWDEHKAGLPEAIGAELWIDIRKTADRQARKAARGKG